MGDSVDNIPGIPKVGPKTACKWLKEYGSLQKIITHASEIKGKVGENLRNHLDHIPLTQQLVTIKTDIKLDTPIDQLKLQNPDHNKLQEFYKEFGFKRLIQETTEDNKTTPTKDSKSNYKLILEKQDFTNLINEISKEKKFSFDTETTSLSCHKAQLVGLSIAIKPHEAYYIPIQHSYENAPDQLDKTWVLNQLQPIFSNNNITLIAQNAKYDLQILFNENIHPRCHIQDTMVMAYVIDSAGRHDMNTLSQRYLNYTPITYDEITGKGKDKLNFSQVDKVCEMPVFRDMSAVVTF